MSLFSKKNAFIWYYYILFNFSVSHLSHLLTFPQEKASTLLQRESGTGSFAKCFGDDGLDQRLHSEEKSMSDVINHKKLISFGLSHSHMGTDYYIFSMLLKWRCRFYILLDTGWSYYKTSRKYKKTICYVEVEYYCFMMSWHFRIFLISLWPAKK